jgi:hypothetical protein
VAKLAGPVSEFLADMPSTRHSFQDGLLKAIDGLPMPSAGPFPPSLSHQEVIKILPTTHVHWWIKTQSTDMVYDIADDIVYDIICYN